MPARRKKPHSKRRQGGDEVPVTSMGDIAFLLIIFFILVTSLVQIQGFYAKIPSGEKSDNVEQKGTSVILRMGKIRLNDEPVRDAQELRGKLAELKLDRLPDTNEKKIVIFEAIGRVKYQDYFSVMAAIADAGGIIGIVREDKAGG